MKKIAIVIFAGLLAAATVGVQSCVKKGNDVPEDFSAYDPQLKTTHTVAQLLSMPTYAPIAEEVIVAGVVCMDDRSGNYYKKFVIQDSTGGVEINLDQNNIYNDYPVGRKVYLKAKGLTLSEYGGMKQLGYGVDERMQIISIPFVMADQFIVKANYPNEVKIDTFTYDQVANPSVVGHLLNKVIAIRDVEFANGAFGVSYAQSTGTTNRALSSCGGSSGIVVRTSNYSKFQAAKTPMGSGVIVGLYTKFNATPQLMIRDTTDVHFGPERCDGSTPQQPDPITITDLRSRFTGSSVPLQNVKISGTVISDRNSGNVQSRNLIVQQGDRGVMVRFTADHIYNLGDSVEINLNGASLEEFRGTLQVNNATVALSSKLGTGTVTPRLVTISALDASFEEFESTLVKIVNVTFPSGTFNGNKTITDGTGSIIMYTSASATFATANIPTGVSSIVGLVGQYDATKQIQIRKLSDVE